MCLGEGIHYIDNVYIILRMCDKFVISVCAQVHVDNYDIK